jgi:hypothetical protein
MNRRLLRNKRSLVIAVLAAILTGTYLMLVLGDAPGNVISIPSPGPFEIAVASDEPTVRLTSIGLGLNRYTDGPLEDLGEGGNLWIHWSQSRVGTPKFAVAIPSDMSFDYMLLESRKGIGSDWKENFISIPGSDAQLSQPRISLPGVSARMAEAKDAGVWVPFNRLWVPLGSRAAGNHKLTINFNGSLEPYRYRLGLGRHKVRLELTTDATHLKQVFSADQVLEPVQRASASAVVGLSYRDIADYRSLLDPVPDPHDVRERTILWRRPLDNRESSMGAQVTTMDERLRFWAARGGEVVILVLGTLVGVFVESLLERRKPSITEAPPTE